MTPLRKKSALAIAAIAILLLSTLRVEVVDGDDMAPSLRDGDLLLLGPGKANHGSVWRLRSPSNPNRRVLRRLVAIEGDRVRYSEGRLFVGGDPMRIREMGRDGGQVVHSESDAWLIRRGEQADRVSGEELTIDEGEGWVMGDSRDEALDSRAWGPLSLDLLERKVWLRFGPSDAWRGRVNLGGADGPWPPPPPSPPPTR